VAPGRVLGVDLSESMLARARDTASEAGLTNAAFERADAQVRPFDPAAFDAVISRFGTMFFADPVAAFDNLRRAIRPGGRLVFVCWQELVANEWLVVPGGAIAEHVAPPDLGGPGAPGMFAFADAKRIKDILHDAGWRDIAVEPRRTPILLGGGGSLEETVDFLQHGSMGRSLLGGVDAETTARAVQAVREALAPHHDGTGVYLEGAVWLVSGTR
jgi:SAM-dependent methyltransferase